MPSAAVPALYVVAAFAVGAIPWGLLLTRWIAGVDVRAVGSGNIGATNASRVLGRKWFFVVFALDAAKGAAPVLLFPGLAGRADAEWLRAACGLAAVLGHVFNPFLRFKGGKGVATTAGALMALAPLPALAALGLFIVVLLTFRMVSLASICTGISLAPISWAFGASPEVRIFGVIVAVVVVVRHASNIGRIAAGTEPRFFDKKDKKKRHDD